MKSLLGLLLGAAVATVIACAAPARKTTGAPPPTNNDTAGGAVPRGSERGEIDRLDGEINDLMSKLSEPRPQPAAPPCAGDKCAQQMSTAAVAAVEPASVDTCKPSKSSTCSEVCTLKDSICGNAGRICRIAADLGGNDAYANDKCSSGSASCDSAKKRCCGCL